MDAELRLTRWFCLLLNETKVRPASDRYVLFTLFTVALARFLNRFAMKVAKTLEIAMLPVASNKSENLRRTRRPIAVRDEMTFAKKRKNETKKNFLAMQETFT